MGQQVRVVRSHWAQECPHCFLYPALLLFYDITNKDSFDNIQVSGLLGGGMN